MPEISLCSEPGTYLIVLLSRCNSTIQIGKSGYMKLEHGYYFYAGSAFGPGGIKARVSRHLKSGKTLRWHIDYLREFTEVYAVVLSYDKQRLENTWADTLSNTQSLTIPKDGFGASDSRNQSHLFYSTNAPNLEQLKNLPGKGITVNRYA